MTLKDEIIKTLRHHLQVEYITLEDKSAAHREHSEAQKMGGGHFDLTIVSKDFEDRSLLKRHQMIYEILKQKFSSEIHALAIKTLTPQEFSR